jgi:transposase
MLKMDVVLLKGLGLHNDLICEITGICGNTMRAYLRQYEEGGIERLKEVHFNRPSSELKEYSGTIEEYFTENPPSSISEASAKIDEITGIKRGETQTRKFLKSLRFRYIKTCSVPAKALTEEKKRTARIFGKRIGTPINKGKKGETKSFFCRCSTFCIGFIFRLFMVHQKNFYPIVFRQKPI